MTEKEVTKGVTLVELVSRVFFFRSLEICDLCEKKSFDQLDRYYRARSMMIADESKDNDFCQPPNKFDNPIMKSTSYIT